MLKKILSVSGKPGLYKLVSQGKSMLIVEALTDGRRLPVYAREKIISLGDIAIYTDGDEVPLYEVLNSVKAKEEGKAVSSIDASRATPDELRAYMAEVLPNFDRERVYPTDIKRLLSWYNLLISAGITVKETHATPPPVVKNTAPKASAAAKTPVGKSTQRMRQK